MKQLKFIIIALFLIHQNAHSLSIKSIKSWFTKEEKIQEKQEKKEENPQILPVKETEEGKETCLPSFADLVEKLKPTVVNIRTTKEIAVSPFRFFFRGPGGERDPFEELFRRFFGEPERKYKTQSLGSGFIISKDGYILTNNHVIQDVTDIRVITVEGKEYNARVVGKDPKTDVALIKIDGKGEFPSAVLGNSDKLRIGEWVIAIGNPFGLGHTVTAGIVSATGRALGLAQYEDFIQTDTPINPGNSGGPLFNLKGEVVGINSAIIPYAQGIGFAIPINLAKSILPQLKEQGYVVRGYLGVYIQPLTPDIAESLGIEEPKGAVVSDVIKGSPAEKAGIKVGDVIVEYNGKEVKDHHQLPILVSTTPPGTVVPIVIIREGKRIKLNVEIAKLEEGDAPRGGEKENFYEDKTLGLVVQNLTEDIIRSLGIERNIRGVLVADVDPDGIASMSGIQRGDLIIEINRKEVRDVSHFKTLINEAIKKSKTLLFLIHREGKNLFITVRVQ